MKFFIIAITVITSITAMGQDNDSLDLKINNRVVVGFKIGLTQTALRGGDMAKLSSDGSSTSGSGFHVGATITSMMSNHLWLRHELLASQKNVGISLKDTINGQYNSSLTWWSIDLYPISPCWSYKGFRAWAGPYLSVLLDARTRKKDSNGQFENDYSIFGSGRNFQRQSNYMQKFDYGINVGVEYQFKNGFNISARYTRGYAELFDWANSLTLGKPTDPTSISIYTEFVNFSIGYDFAKGRKSNSD